MAPPPRPPFPTDETPALPFGAADATRWLAAIIESSDDAILSKDLNGIISSWNAGAQRLFGYTAAEVIGRPVTLLIPDDRQDEETEILARIRRGERIEHYETVRQRKDGTCFDASLTVSPVKDEAGRVIGASKIARDITDRKKSEQALRLSEERFRLLASHAPVGIFLSDASGRCVFVNDHWREMSGLTVAQAWGDGWANAVHPEDRERVLAGWRQAVAAGEPSTSEFRFRRPDGRVVWLQGSAQLIKDDAGAPSYLGSCVDITARKQAELHAAFLHRLTDQLARLTDPDQIMDVAQAALGEFLEADRCYFFEMIQSENLAIVRRDWRRPGLTPTAGNHPLDQYGTPEFLAWLAKPRGGITDVLTHPVTRANPAGYLALSMRGLATSTLSKDGRRMLSLAVATCQPREWPVPELDLIENVTARVWPAIERARASQSLRASEQLYRAVGESLNYGIWVCDAEGRNLYASDSFLQLIGITQAQCSALGWADLLHPDEIAGTTAAWLECVRTGKIWEREHHFKGADGRWHPVLARGVPIRDADGRIVQWVGINLDIAERERAKDTDLFLGRLSHRLGQLTDPIDILHVASAEMGRQLGVDRCGFAERTATGDAITVAGDWARDTRPRLAGTYPIATFADSAVWRAQVDNTLAVEDTETHHLTRERRDNFRRLGLRSFILAPFVREDKWPITLVAGCEQPRVWETHELDLIEKALARVRPIIEQARSAQALQISERLLQQRSRTLEVLNRAGNALVAEHELEKIVQAVTDAGREISGAGFGAFFYNVANEAGESYTLYTLSGVPREAFAKFPMPRATALFGPTFRGEGVVRVADVLQDPRYGKSGPHHGMPAGHLPVRSYLAVPVIARSGEVLGGLFFGHAEPGVFTEEAQKVVVALAAQAAIAIDNAKLYTALQRELDEQRRTEAKLRDSEHRWRQLAEAMPHLVWTCRPDGFCDYLSPQWVAYTGLPEVDQLGEGWVESVHPDDRATLTKRWAESVSTGGLLDTEFRIRRTDGKYRWFKTRAVAIRDDEGRIIKWYGTNTDIEDFRRIERAIRESEHQLRLVTDHAPIFLAHLDRHHRFKFVNRTYAERYGLKREEIIGRHVSEITGVEAYETFRLHMDATLAGQRSEIEQEIPYSSLGRRWVRVSYEPERASPESEVTGLVAVIVDITARKQVELELEKARDEALAASRAKDDFLAALSHELRTPLSPVLLVASDAANNPALPREIRETFDMIRSNVSLEARLIDDLLDLTRITRGKMSLEKHAVEVHAVLHDALANIRAEIDEKAMVLDLSLDAPQSTVSGDAVRLQQVFWNILKNAVKFTSDGGRIRVGSRVDGGKLLVEVADSGIGMSAAELSGVFEAFAQGDHARASGAHRFGGLGLGLAIARKLIELQGGTILARSPGRGRGSTFIVELPLQAAARPVSAAPVPADGTTGSTPPASAAAGSILLVEDHPSTRATLEKLLSRRNFEVVPAGTAQEARQLAAARHFDFLLSDVGLPDGDGYQLMSELRRMQPDLRGIAVSGYGMEDDLQRSRTAGFAAHLVKPVSIAALEKAFANLARKPGATSA